LAIRCRKAALGRNLTKNERKDRSNVATDVTDIILLVMPHGVGGAA